MRRRVRRMLLSLFLPYATIVLASGISMWAWSAKALAAREKSIESIVEATVAKRAAESGTVTETDLKRAGTIRILLLGLDAREADLHPHCDAIHLFSIDTKQWTVSITSVPRGTYAYIPKEKLDWEKFDSAALEKRLAQPKPKPEMNAAMEPAIPSTEPPPPLTPEQKQAMLETAFVAQESYLANACAFMGLDYGEQKIEGVLGEKADYRVTIGFSQTMGALRLLNLPAADALQWLRHRQSYAVGEPQRSHNQATFMKDLLVADASRLANPISLPLARVFYSFVDTDLDFDTAYSLLRALAASGIDKHPERVTLSMRPAYPTTDYHFDAAHPLDRLQPFYGSVAPRLSPKDYSGATLDDVQSALTSYLDQRLASADPTDDLMEKQIWLQVEDAESRERIHLALVERAAHGLADQGQLEDAIDLVTAFVVEKETLGLDASAKDGRALLAELIARRQT